MRSICLWRVRKELRDRDQEQPRHSAVRYFELDLGARRSSEDFENPVLLANRKCKRLKSLLVRQRAFKKEAQPFIEPIVFLSHPLPPLLFASIRMGDCPDAPDS